MAFPAHPIHDLHSAHVTTDGLEKPLLPGAGFVVIANGKQRLECEGRVAKPTISIIPVTISAESLRERSRGCRNDTPARTIGQGFERDQRALDGVFPRAIVLVDIAPALPKSFRLLESFFYVDTAGCIL